jgi:hypothetical protein
MNFDARTDYELRKLIADLDSANDDLSQKFSNAFASTTTMI